MGRQKQKTYTKKIGAILSGVALLLSLFQPVLTANAQIPQTINYQSRLRTIGGVPITATTTIQFSLYNHISNGSSIDAPGSAGPLLWKETYDQASGACSSVQPDAQGYFFVQLGSCVAFPAYIEFDSPLYLGVKISADAEAAPRVLLASFPYALNSQRVNSLEATTTATGGQLLALEDDLDFNIATGTFYGGGLSVTGTSTLQNFTFTVATGTSLNLDQYLAIGAIRLDSTGTNNVTSGAYLVGVFDEFTNSNATTVQAALFDLDTAITAVSSSLFAIDLQQVTDNGATTTNRIQFAGATSTGDIIPGAHDTYSLGNTILRWSDIWSGIVHVGTSTWDLAQAGNGAFTVSQNGGSERMRITSNGNVGIGTNQPEQMLSVRDTVLIGQYEGITPPSGKNANLILRAIDGFSPGTQGSAYTTFQRTSADIARMGIDTLNSINFDHWDGLDWATRMMINSAGNVGIGTILPSTLLHVQGGNNGDALLTLDSDDGNANGRDAGIIINSDNNNGSDAAYLIFKNNGVQSAKFLGGTTGSGFDLAAGTTFNITQDGFSRLHMTNSGNFGFATDTPAYVLDVLGDARLSAQLMLGQYAVNPISGNQAGAMVYNTASSTPFYWDGSEWVALLGASALTSLGWLTTGNIGTNSINNFIGTIDNQNLAFRTNNVQNMILTATGLLGIGSGVGIPGHMLEVAGNLGFALMDDSGDQLMEVSGNLGAGTAIYQMGDVTGVDTETLFTINPAEEGFYFTDGNVGIGTTTPSTLLHVQGGLNGRAVLVLDSDDGNADGQDAGIYINSDYDFGSDAAFIEFANNGTPSGKLYSAPSESAFNSYGNTPFHILTNGTHRITATGLGNVGIATTSPAYRLDVVGDARLSAQLMLGRYAVLPASGNQSGSVLYNTASSTVHYWDGSVWRTVATAEDVRSSLWDEDHDTGVQVEESGDEDYIRFDTAGVERMFIQSNGRIGINTTGPLVAGLQIGQGGHMNAALSINGNPGDTGIAAFRDEDGEDIFTAMGSLADNDFQFMIGDNNGAYANSYSGNTAFKIDQANEFYSFGRAQIRFTNSGVLGDYVGFLAPSTITSSTIWTLPGADGVNNQVLVTDGAGTLSWATSSDLVYNIYNSDGLIPEDRDVTIASGFELKFVDQSNPANFLYFQPDYNTNGNLRIGAVNNDEGNTNHYLEFMDNFKMVSEHGIEIDASTSQVDLYGNNAVLHIGADNQFFDLRAAGSKYGLRYEGDYSADFVARSLVDKAYVDNKVASSTNNIYGADGIITGDRTVTSNGNALLFTGTAGNSIELNAIDGAYNSFLSVYPDQFEIYSSDGTISTNSIATANGITYYHNAIAGSIGFEISTDFIVTDHINNRGVVYDADYSANYTNRSLVDKEYVDSHISAVTMQGAADNSIATDGYVFYNTGAADWEDDGGAMKIEAKAGGYQVGMGEAGGSRLSFKSDNGILNPMKVSFTDNRALGERKGIEYEGDYSADFVARSLVDKGYVDNAITSSTVSATNGLTLNSGVLKLGGSLTEMTYIDHQGYDLIIREFAGEPETLFAGDNFKIKDGDYEVRFGIGGPSSVGLTLENPSSTFSLLNFNDYVGVNSSRTDFLGLVYDKDYSAYFVDRSLVDKAYVDNYLSASAGNGLTWDAINNEIDLGGNLTQSTTINYGNFDFRIQNANNYQLFNATNYANYYSDGVTNTNLLQNKDNIQFSGSAGFVGATYLADYSADYTNRSLVDKEYVDSAIVSATTTLNAAYNAGGSALGRQIFTLNNANPVEILNPGTDQWETGLALTNASNGSGIAFQTMESSGDYGGRLFFTDNTADPENGTGSYMNMNNLTEAFEFGYQTAGTRNSSFYIDYSQMALNIPGSVTSGAFSVTASNYNVPSMTLRVPGPSLSNQMRMSVGTSTPEAKVTGESGSIFFRTDGTGSSQQLYVKATDGGNTGWFALAGADSNHWQKNTNVLSPTDSAVYQIGVTNNNASTLTGFKAVNTNDASNYAGAVIEVKGSGADYTNNMYFGKYGAAFWIPTWAGNGVLATDKNLVLGAVGASSIIRYQIGGGYSAPVTVATMDSNSMDFQSGVNVNVASNVIVQGLTSSTNGLFINATGTNLYAANQVMLGQHALNPVSGIRSGALIYNTASSTPFYWDGTEWIALGGSSATAGSLWDADHDTGIQVEQSPDEDIIRFDTAGTEYFTMQGPRLSVLNSGSSVFLGQNAGRVDNLSNRQNVYVGNSAGYNNVTGLYNVSVGYEALYTHTNPNNTTAIGYHAGRNYSGAFGGTMVGYKAGYQSTGNNNVMIGYESGMESSGTGNFFMGRGTGWYNTGDNNIMMGYYTGYDNKGSSNILFGLSAGLENKGNRGIFLGENAGRVNVGDDNIFLGYNSGRANATGTRNLFLGRDAGYNNVLGNGNIFLGYQAGYSETNSDRLYIDNSNTSAPLVYGEFDTNVFRINGALQINNPSSTGYALPVVDGGSGQILITNGNGNVSWASTSVLGTDTFQTVTDNGNTTTNAIEFAGGTSTANLIVGNDLVISSQGRIGMGISNPISRLEIKSTNTNTMPIRVQASDGSWLNELHEDILGNGYWRLMDNTGIARVENYALADGGLFNLYDAGGSISTQFNAAGDSYVNNGNFGVGTSTPQTPLHVVSNLAEPALRVYSTLGDLGGMIELGDIENGTLLRVSGANGGDTYYPGLYATMYLNLSSGNGHPIRFFNGSTQNMTLLDNGYLGIGDTTPTHKLDVQGSTTPGDNLFRIGGGANGAYISMYASTTDDRNSVIEVQRNLDFFSQGNHILSMAHAGNVGVGTFNPSYSLDVVGDSRLSAQLMLGQYALNPASGSQSGAMIYNTASSTPFFWSGTAWKAIASQDLITLDKAYDAGGLVPGGGRQISVDSGPVSLTDGGDGTSMYIENAGLGQAISMHQSGASEAVYIRQVGGRGILLENNTANDGLVVATADSGTGIQISNEGSSSNGMRIDNDTDGAGIFIEDTLGKAAINISKPSGSGDLFHLSNLGTGDVFDINSASTGIVFRLANTGTGDSLYITDDALDSSPFVLTARGDLGIGTATPDARLEITGNNSLADVTLLKFQSTNNSDIQSEIYFSGGGNATNWNVNSSGNGGALIIKDGTSEVGKFLNNGFIINDGGLANVDFRVESDTNTHAMFVDATNGYVGFDQSVPLAKLHVGNTTAGSAADYEYMRLQGNGDVDHRLYIPTASNLMIWDYNVTGNGGAIEFRNGASRVGLFTNSGLVINDGGVAGVGLRVEGDTDVSLLYTDAANNRVGIGTNSPATKLFVKENGATVVAFDRTNTDGTIVSLRQDGVEEGTISVSGNTVSYNAFTGSHYAWTDENIEKGMLVSLTGENRYLHNNVNSEILYGVTLSAEVNDAKIMGSYLSIQEPGMARDEHNPHLIMAVGNGEVWVADKGENINIGDYFVSSDIAGHAQKDTGEFMVSHIVARAAESVDWTHVSTQINGVKHKKISVFFESFDKNNIQDSVAGTSLQGGEDSLDAVDLVVADAVFEGNITVKGHVAFGKDVVGQAMIMTGDTRVTVDFTEDYGTLPIVTLTPAGKVTVPYWVENASLQGFDIVLDEVQYADLIFNWHAFGNDEGRVYVSNGTTMDIIVNDMGGSDLETELNALGQDSADSGMTTTTDEGVTDVTADTQSGTDDSLVDSTIDATTDTTTDEGVGTTTDTSTDITSDITSEASADSDQTNEAEVVDEEVVVIEITPQEVESVTPDTETTIE